MGPVKCLDAVPGALGLESVTSFTLNRPCFLSGRGGLRRDALEAGPLASDAKVTWLRFKGLEGVKSGHSVYTSLSAPRDLSVGQRCIGEATEANVLASTGTAGTREADLSWGHGE